MVREKAGLQVSNGSTRGNVVDRVPGWIAFDRVKVHIGYNSYT